MLYLTMAGKLLKKWWPVLAIALVVGGFIYWKAQLVEDSIETGVQQERGRNATETLERVGEANNAKNDVIDPTKYSKYCECLRSSRTSDVCERYVPSGHDYSSKPASVCKAR